MNVADLTKSIPRSLGDSPWAPWAGMDAQGVAHDVLGRIHPALAPVSADVIGASVRDGWLYLARRTAPIVVGPPVADPGLPEEWAHLDRPLPAALVALYGRTGGFGPAGRGGRPWRDGLVAPDRLAPLLSRMRFGEEDILYDPTDLLVLSSDGRGGAWCLCPGTVETRVVRWDHTSHALSDEQPLDAWLATLARRW